MPPIPIERAFFVLPMPDFPSLLSSLFSDRIVSLLTFLMGLLIGHRTALLRDLRKEFNDAAAPIRAWLLKETQSPSCYGAPPSVVEIDRFVHCLHWWKRKGFLCAWDKQRAARKQQLTYGSLGQAGYSDPDAVSAAVKSCLVYTAPR